MLQEIEDKVIVGNELVLPAFDVTHRKRQFKCYNLLTLVKTTLYEVICDEDNVKIIKELISSMCAADIWKAVFLPHGMRSIAGADALEHVITKHEIFIHTSVSYSMFFLLTNFLELPTATRIDKLPGVHSIENTLASDTEGKFLFILSMAHQATTVP
mmetsp:Transcript_15520/g.22124  ORF Transcript_15520/g.22124 Transcript_15520/m.22124 type:complete len:157 (-) Transcript_15520:159-629(-)